MASLKQQFFSKKVSGKLNISCQELFRSKAFCSSVLLVRAETIHSAFCQIVLFPSDLEAQHHRTGGWGGLGAFQLMAAAAAPINKLEDFLKLVWKKLKLPSPLPPSAHTPPCGEKRGACVRAKRGWGKRRTVFLWGEGGRGISFLFSIQSDYLRQILVELSNERLPFFFQLFDFLLQLRGLLLLVLQRLDQLVSLVEHGDHQLLEVGVVAELRRPLRDRVLGDGRHHVAHHVPHLGRLRRSGSAETRSL